MEKITRQLNDGDTHGYLDGEKLVRTQNGLIKKADNTHAVIGQNGKIESIFKMEVADVVEEAPVEQKPARTTRKKGDKK